MERSLGYIIGGCVIVLTLISMGVLFSGVVLGALSALIAFPLAAPMTTTALLIALGIGFVAYRRKRRRSRKHGDRR